MKAVLVIDMPNRCSECYLNQYGCICVATSKNVYNYTDNKREDCPLKSLPKRKDVPENLETSRDWEAWGYDQCLAEILGDVEGETE